MTYAYHEYCSKARWYRNAMECFVVRRAPAVHSNVGLTLVPRSYHSSQRGVYLVSHAVQYVLAAQFVSKQSFHPSCEVTRRQQVVPMLIH